MVKKRFFKMLAMLAVGAIAINSIGGEFTVKAEGNKIPPEIILPISLIDYNADNLLFQYDLGDVIGSEFAFTSSNFNNSVEGSLLAPLPYETDGQTLYYVKGLVESRLSDGVPKYTKAAVQKAAELVQAQLAKPAAGATTDSFQDLQNRLVTKDADAVEFSGMTDASLARKIIYFYDYGWQIQGEGYTQADGVIKDNTGKVIWQQEGDGILYYGSGNAGDALVLTVTGLNPALRYRINSWKGFGADQAEYSVDLQVYNGESLIESDKAARVMEVSGVSEITLKIVPTPGMEINGEKIAALHVWELNDSGETKVCDNILNQVEKSNFEYTGWKAVNADLFTVNEGALLQDGIEKWKFDGDGLEGRGTSEAVYKELTLRAGKQYLLSYLGASAMQIDIYDAEGSNELIKENIQTGDMFTCPASGKVKIVVTGSGEEYKTYAEDTTWWQRNKLAQLALSEISCPLGTYEESEQKYADGTKGYEDITTCMDYAYYMLNNLFVVEADTNKQPFAGYQTLTLSQIEEGKSEYEFVADISELTDVDMRYAIVYDEVGKNIRNDRTTTAVVDGLFPLDSSPTKEAGYLGISGAEHNFHYALSSQAYFYYDEAEELYFEFAGDDDVYLFINEKLALDIGGAHLAAKERINLNEMQEQLGLESGNVYKFNFFYLERHTDYSNFYIKTNIQLLKSGELAMNFYQDNQSIQSGGTVNKGSKAEVEYVLTSNTDGLKAIQFTDTGLGISVGKEGLTYADAISIAETGVTITVYNKDESVKSTFSYTNSEEIKDYFNTLTLQLGEKVAVRGFLFEVEEKIEANVSVTFDTPHYAGVNSNMVSNEDTVTGELDVKAKTPSDDPVGGEDKPTDDGDDPTGNGGNPTDDGDDPTDDGDKPTGDGNKPTGDGDNPTDDGNKPTGDGDAPTDNGDKPTGDSDKTTGNDPADGGDKPTGDGDNPTGDSGKTTGDKPTEPSNPSGNQTTTVTTASTAQDSQVVTAPKTGDDTPIGVYVICLLFGIVIICSQIRARRYE